MVVQVGLRQFLFSSVGSKQVVALTGLGLVGFVVAHMLGNFLIFAGPDAYNAYSHALIKNPLILVAEFALLGIFLAHVIVAVRLNIGNQSARPVGYAVRSKTDKGTCLRQRTLVHQGAVIAVFIVHHLITFKFGAYYETTVGGVVMRDLYRLVIEVFQHPVYVGWYVVALVALGFHLSHGITSVIQTLGLHHPKFQFHFKCLGVGLGGLLALGFLIQPLYVFFFYK